MNPAGGVEMGWQLAMRSKSPYGPYEWKRVLWQGRTSVNGPHQGAWLHSSQGEDWFLHFNDRFAYGRVVYLQPVDWSSGWPIMGNHGEPYTTYRKPKSAPSSAPSSASSAPSSASFVPSSASSASVPAVFTAGNPQESDDFSSGLGLQWQWHANYDQLFGMPTADGCYRLYTYDLPSDFRSLWQVPNLLLQKPTAPRFTATAKVRFASKNDHQYGGLIMMGRDYSALVVYRQGDDFLLQRHTCISADEGQPETIQTLATLTPTERDTIPYSPAIYLDLYLRMTVKDGQCCYSYSLDGKRYRDAGPSFTMRQGKWIGAKFGFVAECRSRKGANRGWLDIDWIRITK